MRADKNREIWLKENWQDKTPFPDLGDSFPSGKCRSIRECQKELWEKANINPQMAHSHLLTYNIPLGMPAMQSYCYGNRNNYERDAAYTKKMYPGIIRRIQTEVEDRFDSLEYENSIIYDAYPDKEGLQSIVREVYEKVLILPGIQKIVSLKGDTVSDEGWNNLLYYITEILFYQELVLRRNRK